MNQYTAIILMVAALIAAAVYTWYSREKRRRTRIEAAFGAVPAREGSIDSMQAYDRTRQRHAPAENRIDDITWNDLDMDRVYRRINACLSSVGEEYLYAALRTPSMKTEAARERDELRRLLADQPALRLQIQLLYDRLGRTAYNGAASLLYEADAKSLPYAVLYRVLAVCPLLCVGLLFALPTAGVVLLLLSVISNGIIHFKVKKRLEGEMGAIRYFSSMLWCAGKLVRLTGLASTPIYERLQNGYAAFRSLRGSMTTMLRVPSDMEFLIEYVKIIFLYDVRSYSRIVRSIVGDGASFRMLYEALGELDTAVSVLSFEKSLPGHCRPLFHQEKSIVFEGMYHPLLAEPVKNSGVIGNDSLITGSNASGKSTFIKALAVNGILAQTIGVCAADVFCTRPALVMSSMAMRDSLSEGDSYFVTEIRSLGRILTQVKSTPCICYIDEILRGTNTVERIAASAAVLRALHEADCLCIAATHDIELTEILKAAYDNYHFCEQMTEEGMTFDYLLKEGASNTRNAIRLLDHMGFGHGIVEEAEGHAAWFDQNRAWRIPDRAIDAWENRSQ